MEPLIDIKNILVVRTDDWSSLAEEAPGEGKACLWRGQYYDLNATWQWQCNVCACVGGRAVCTRVWCGLPDCMATQVRNCLPNQVYFSFVLL